MPVRDPALQQPRPVGALDDDALLRHSRHILLDDIGIEGQRRWAAATVLLVGAGGLGSPVALYLAAAGVGRIVLVDPDTVELTNLQRQIAHRTADIGQAKVESARRSMRALNDAVVVEALRDRADEALLDRQVPRADVVIDCTDNYATRQAINAACVRHRRPLVSGAALGFDGQLTVVDPRTPGPCYACLHDPAARFEEQACATMGVFAPLVGTVGSLQAAEALKLLAGLDGTLVGRLAMIDLRRGTWDTIGYTRRPGCTVCDPPTGERA